MMPEQLAPVFAWKVTAFMTMTIGGWCIGNAWIAYITARRWKWNLVYSSLIYLWIFGIGELIVLFLFRDKLVLVHPIAWLYFVTLLVNVLAAIVGVVDYLRIRPSNVPDGEIITNSQKIPTAAFVLFVGFLGLYGLTAQIGDVGTNGGIFPEVMSLFTLRSFGVFYFSPCSVRRPLFLEEQPQRPPASFVGSVCVDPLHYHCRFRVPAPLQLCRTPRRFALLHCVSCRWNSFALCFQKIRDWNQKLKEFSFQIQ